MHCLSILVEGNGSSVHIKEGVVVNAYIHSRTCMNAIEGKHIKIGKGCLFSNGVELHTSDYHSIVMADNRDKRLNRASDIVLGARVWIGLRTIILKGSNIADDTVVGACSLVNKHFDKSNILIAGIPAVELKSNINWDRYKYGYKTSNNSILFASIPSF